MSPTFHHKLMLFAGKILNYPIRYFHKKVGIKNILVVKIDDLGDMIVWRPYAQALKEKFADSNYRIHYLITKTMLPLAQAFGFADHYIVFDRYKNPLQWIFFRIKFWIKYDFCLIISTNYFRDDIFAIYSYADSIGVAESKEYEMFFNFYKKQLHWQGWSIHKQNQALLDYVGIKPISSPMHLEMNFSVLPSELGAEKFILVCPGAGAPNRCWEVEKFMSLVEKLIETYGMKVVLVGNAKEKQRCAHIKQNSKYSERIMDLSGKTTLLELISCVNQAEFVVSNETGTAHIGAALGKKTFIICGGGDYGHFIPYPDTAEGKYVFSIFRNGDHSCFPCFWAMPCCSNNKYDTAPCIKDISVEQVFNAIVFNFKIS